MNSGYNKRKQLEPSNKKKKTTKCQCTINDMLHEMREIYLENEYNHDNQDDDKNERCDKAN